MFRDCGNLSLWKSSLWKTQVGRCFFGESVVLPWRLGGGGSQTKNLVVVTLSYGRQAEKMTYIFVFFWIWVGLRIPGVIPNHETLFCRIITQCISWSSHGLCQTYLIGLRLRNASVIFCFRVMDWHLRTCWPSSRGLLLNKHPYWRPTACSYNGC